MDSERRRLAPSPSRTKRAQAFVRIVSPINPGVVVLWTQTKSNELTTPQNKTSYFDTNGPLRFSTHYFLVMKFSVLITLACTATVSALVPVAPSRKTSNSRHHASASFFPQQPQQQGGFDAPVVPQQQAQSTTKNSGVSLPLIRAIWYNQASVLIGSTVFAAAAVALLGGGSLADLHWNGAGQNFASFFDMDMTPVRLFQGIAATVPLVALGSAVERSDHRDASHINFSTTNMVIRLFGRRKSSVVDQSSSTTSTPHMMLLSLSMALSTGIAEELVFRGYLPTIVGELSHSIALAWFAQAALFAVGHLSPHVSSGENKIIGGLQFANGLWYGIVYLLTGGDLLPCIISHMLYDLHIFSGTWTSINNQLDYTQKASLPSTEEARIAAQAGAANVSPASVDFARRFFYAFDSQHQGSLTHSDVQRAITYAFLVDKRGPTPQDVTNAFEGALEARDEHHDLPADRLGASEFINLLFSFKSQHRQ